MAGPPNSEFPALPVLENISAQSFISPVKKINEGHDVSHFLQSKAYRDIMTFLLQLNRAMFPSLVNENNTSITQTWEINSPNITYSDTILHLRTLISTLKTLINEAPPDPGPRRFGNTAFRHWSHLLTTRAPSLLKEHLPSIPPAAHPELLPYLLNSFGSAQRLDYGSGHELSFLAFLASTWKLAAFAPTNLENESRAIVLGLFQPYLSLIRLLISTYTLEPAGSHGVWGLDDHSFLPYIFGSAQLGPAVPSSAQTPIEGSLDGAPSQSDIVTADKAARYRDSNMYFSAIAFIHEVKTGPFWEHSPMLYDISGVTGGWGKINKGMVKMWSAEVLGKFPVVQHFVFGELFSWEADPLLLEEGMSGTVILASRGASVGGEKGSGGGQEVTKAPWVTAASTTAGPMMEGTKAPWVVAGNLPNRDPPSMRRTGPSRPLREAMPQQDRSSDTSRMPPPTKAPWAKPD